MTDIVKRLRDFAGPRYPDDICGKACMGEAAAEIERLRKERDHYVLTADVRAICIAMLERERDAARREGIEAAAKIADGIRALLMEGGR